MPNGDPDFEKKELPILEKYSLNNIDMITLLNDKLNEIIQWEFGKWNKVHYGNKRIWKRFSKNEFKNLNKDLPFPK
jgi:hypothetical protein